MGNYISCALSPSMENSKAARVIFPTGEIRQFRHPVKAAEIMLESPNFFLTNSHSLHIARRFAALAADEELEFGNVYIMFPMRRLNSVVVAADMALFFMAANSAAKRLSGRVLPESGGPTHGAGEGFPVPEFMYRLSVCRSRKPMLETIREEPVCSR